jgi:hypothetical protein
MQATDHSFLTGRKNKFISYTAMLVLISVVVRVLVYLLLPASDDFGKYANSGPLYFSALTEHFKDYLIFTTNIPPGTFVVQAAVFGLVDPETAMSVRAFLILISMLNITGIVLLFQSAKKIGANERFSFLVCCLFSIALISFELWRDGMHYDHLTFFFTSLFVGSLVKVIRNADKLFNALLVAVTTALLISQSAANAAIAPFTVVAVFCLLYLPKKKYLKFGLALIIGLSMPLLILIIIGKKNSAETQESLTSNKAGPAMMMVVQRAYDFDVAKVRSIMQRGGAPEWYLWTYDHSTPPVDHVTLKSYPEAISLSQAFGMCFFSAEVEGPWKFDFNPLMNYLSQNGPKELLPIVKADAEDVVMRPYRLAGFSPELSPRWIGVYGSVSKKIFFKALTDNPGGMLKAFAKQQSVFGICGPLFMYNVSQNERNFLARGALRTLKEKLPLHLLIEAAALIFAALALGVYVLSFGFIPFALFKSIRNKNNFSFYTTHPFLLLSIPVICIAVVYSCLVGGENDRYFMQATPYIVIMVSYLTVMFKKYLQKYHFLQQFI